MRVLVIEDEPDLARQMAATLEEAGYAVDVAHDGEEGHFLGDTEPYDVVVLDLGLPVIDGLTVLERWRRDGKDMPVLILTARDRWSEKVAGFDAGADDYVTKPFQMEELLARLRALIRRTAGHATVQLECGPVVLDTRSGRVTADDVTIKLTAQEYKITGLSDASSGENRLAHRTHRACLRPRFRPRFQHHRGVHRPPAQEARR